MAMRILVTGGAGFIGSHVVDLLAEEGADVIVVDDLSTGHYKFIERPDKITFIPCSVAQLTSMMPPGIDVIVHLAAQGGVSKSIAYPLETFERNVYETLALADLASSMEVMHFVLFSSSSVYGGQSNSEGKQDESMRLCAKSPYAASKIAAEAAVQAVCSNSKMNGTCLRPFNVYGPRQTAASAVVPTFIECLLEGLKVSIHGDGLQCRDFTYVEDVVTAVRAAIVNGANEDWNVYNVCGGETISIHGLLDLIANVDGRKAKVNSVAKRPGDVRFTHGDNELIRRELDWSPAIPIEVGLRKTIEWHKQQGQA